MWQSAIATFALSACGATGHEYLGKFILVAFFGSWTTVHLNLIIAHTNAAQKTARAIYLLLLIMQLGNMRFALSERWIALLIWYGGLFLLVAAALAPFDFLGRRHPSAFFLMPGAFAFLMGCALAIGRERTLRDSHSLVQQDIRAYDALWLLLRRASLAALAALDRVALRLGRRAAALPGIGAAAAPPAQQLVRPPLARRRSSGIGRLAELSRGGSFRRLLADLELLYAQVPVPPDPAQSSPAPRIGPAQPRSGPARGDVMGRSEVKRRIATARGLRGAVTVTAD
jgi:hypothetical protein